jgi:predicted component of type VI protein secretion system
MSNDTSEAMAGAAQVISFSDLLDMREDLSEIEDNLDQIAGYWAEVSEVLKKQAEQAEGEKADAILETADMAADVSKRIDEGEFLFKAREEQ